MQVKVKVISDVTTNQCLRHLCGGTRMQSRDGQSSDKIEITESDANQTALIRSGYETRNRPN